MSKDQKETPASGANGAGAGHENDITQILRSIKNGERQAKNAAPARSSSKGRA